MRFNGGTTQYTVTDDSTMQTSVPPGGDHRANIGNHDGRDRRRLLLGLLGDRPAAPALVKHALAKGAKPRPTATWPQTTGWW